MAWNYDTISRALSEMARENYEDMVKAFLAMELNIQTSHFLIRSIKTLGTLMTCL